jgi:predicted translin family RNA/ssDNA-binding protein
MASAAPPSATQSIFAAFRNELDEHHDRRERVVKVSRDITALSKKMYVVIGENCLAPLGLKKSEDAFPNQNTDERRDYW